MMSDDKPRGYRIPWPGPMSVAGVEPGHGHELPPALVQRVKLLTRAVVIFGVCLLMIGTFLVLIILERSDRASDERSDLKREIRNSWCTALDTFPEGGASLDRLRARYKCGPGMPLASLTPEEQEEWARIRPPAARLTQPQRPEDLPAREGPGPQDFPLPEELPQQSPPEPAPGSGGEAAPDQSCDDADIACP